MEKQCPIEYSLSLISGKWKVMIMKELSHGALRYGVLGKCIPTISAKVLIQQLRELERDGLILRTIYPEVPPKVEYSASKKGESVYSLFVALRGWSLELNEPEKVECRMCGKCQPYVLGEDAEA